MQPSGIPGSLANGGGCNSVSAPCHSFIVIRATLAGRRRVEMSYSYIHGMLKSVDVPRVREYSLRMARLNSDHNVLSNGGGV